MPPVWHLPRRPLGTSTLTTSLVAVASVATLSLLACAVLPLGAMYPLKACAAVVAAAVLAIGFLDHHRFERFGAANQITMARAACVALLAALVGEPRVPAVQSAAVATALLATIMDGADGWLARRTNMTTAFGARFDMEVDAFLILVLATLAWRFEKAGAWVLLSGLVRYLFVAAGWLFEWIREPLPPSLRRKAICVLQVVSLIFVLVPAVVPPLSMVVAAVGLGALVWSFVVDIVWLWRPSAASSAPRIVIT